jgi:predicted nucleotidyltransferase
VGTDRPIPIEKLPLLRYADDSGEVSRMAKYTRHVYTLAEIKDIVTPIAKLHGVAKVSLFGSYARGEAIWKSDVDFRIDSGNIRTLFDLGGLYADLEEGLRKPVDIVTSDAMSAAFSSGIQGDEVVIYEAVIRG